MRNKTLEQFRRELNEAINSGRNINRPLNDDGPNNMLAHACWVQDTQSVQRLIDLKADVSTIGEDGETPLFWASTPETAYLLIKHGADVNKQNRRGVKPLNNAMEADPPLWEVATLLVEHGADVNHIGRSGYTALMLCMLEGDFFEEAEQLALHLLRHGADANIKSVGDLYPLHHARAPSVIASLIESGADVTTKNSDGQTPLDWLQQWKNECTADENHLYLYHANNAIEAFQNAVAEREKRAINEALGDVDDKPTRGQRDM